MARYWLCYDGSWQESFGEEARALALALEVSEVTGGLVHVVRRGIILSKLVAVFPEDRVEEGEWLWRIRSSGADYGGGTMT